MGAELRLPMQGPLRREVLENKYFFSSVTEQTLRGSGGKTRPKVQTGDADSEVRLEKQGVLTVAVFTYALDNDSDPSNGRIYLKDRFVFDPKEKKLHHAERNFFLASAGPDGFWEKLKTRLIDRVPPLSADPPGTRRFFENVVLKIPDFSFEGDSEAPLPWAALRRSFPPPQISQGRRPRNLLSLAATALPFSEAQRIQGRVDFLMDHFLDGIGSPILLGSLFTGGAAFHWAEGAVLSRWGGQGLRSALLATGAGVALEAPVFRLTERALCRSFFQEELKVSGDEVFDTFLSFGALRGAGLGVRFGLAGIAESSLIYGRATYPILHHGASFGALHGIHEVERLRHPSEGSWSSRVLEDGVFYLQAGLASHLAQGTLGPTLSQRTTELRRADELKMRVEKAPDSHWEELKEKAYREKIEDWENRFTRLLRRTEEALEGAEAQSRENTFLRGALSEALERAKDSHGRVEDLERRLKKNKFGTEKVIEWARLKEKENSGVRAGLEDALQHLEAMSAETAQLKGDLEGMTAEFIRRDQEAIRAEQRVEELEALALDWKLEKAELLKKVEGVQAELDQWKARLKQEEEPYEPRISTIVLKGPNEETTRPKEK